MRIGFGNGGWVRVYDVSVAGDVYVRFDQAPDGRPGIREIYVDGTDEPLTPALLRQIRFEEIEAAVFEYYDVFTSRIGTPGPDLHRLAAHYSHTWGSGTFAGGSCETCGGPIKGNKVSGSDRIRSTQNWVAESWFAQFRDSGVQQVQMPRQRPPIDPELEDFPALDPPAGGSITDEFLVSVRLAYYMARRKKLHPAPVIAKLAGVQPKTVHKWIAKARERRIMPAATQGRAG
jgi:hypothetical protein